MAGEEKPPIVVLSVVVIEAEGLEAKDANGKQKRRPSYGLYRILFLMTARILFILRYLYTNSAILNDAVINRKINNTNRKQTIYKNNDEL